LAASSDKFIPASIIGDVLYWLLSVSVHVFTATRVFLKCEYNATIAHEIEKI